MIERRTGVYSKKVQAHCKTIFLYVILIFIVLIILFPFYWIMVVSFMTEKEYFSPGLRMFPANPTLENFRSVFSAFPFFHYLRNTLFIATFSTLISIILASFAGYGLSRFNMRGKGTLGLLMLCSQMSPEVLVVISLFLFLKRFGLTNSTLGLVVVYLSFSTPFCTFMLKGYFDTVPVELEESARIDGCSRVGALFRITLPLSIPGIGATAIFAFILAWNEFIYALTLTFDKSAMTLPIGVYQLIGEHVVKWGIIAAAGVLVSVPVVVIFVNLQKFLVAGLTAGAVKE